MPTGCGQARRKRSLRAFGRPCYTQPPESASHLRPESRVNKQQLVVAVAASLGRSKADAARIVDALFGSEGVIAGELRRGRKVQITGFGHFETRRRAARTARNPRTGRAMTIKASVAPVFRAGKSLKELVNRR
jgi:DNA-binding protein HU-beta